MEEYLPEKDLAKAHRELLTAKQVQKFVFPTRMKNDEIRESVEAAGFQVIVIRPSPIGKMAYFSIPDQRAKKDGLDMAYKLRGSFAPDKKEITGPDGIPLFMPTKEEQEKIDKLLNQLK